MKKTLLYLLPLAAFSCAKAQKPDPIQQKYAAYITAEDARKHLTILASDAFEGRETGKPGAEKAANYLAGEFKKLGLQAPVNGSYFLDVPLTSTSFNFKSFTVNGTTLTYGKDYWSLNSSEMQNIKASELIFVGYGTEAEVANVNLAGKVVMVIGDIKPGTSESTISSLSLRNKNPALIIGVIPFSDPMPGNPSKVNERILLKQTNIKPTVKKILSIAVGTDVANQLLKNSGKTYEQLKSAAGEVQATQTLKADIKAEFETVTKDVKAVDVLGYLPGTDLKDEVLIFSAHYDHIGLTRFGTDKVNNGADDDGSGTTGILEIARAFTQAKKEGHGPRRSILFLGNVGEEKGLLGSEYYTAHPVFPLSQTITDLNIDMIGRTGYDYIGKADSSNYLYVIGSAMLSTTLRKVTEEVNTTYTKLDLDYKYDDPNDPNRFYYRSDHYNFAKHGVPIIFYFDGENPDYHRPGDEVSKINFPMLVKRAQLVFYTGWELANRDERPVVDVKSEKASSQ